jgi:hypothetical protein
LVGLQFGDRDVFRAINAVPAVLTSQLPCGATGHSIAQQANLHFGDALVSLKGFGVGELAAEHTL